MSSDQLSRIVRRGATATSRRGGVLLASSAGGHFTELEIIAGVRGIRDADRHWVVPRTDQTVSRLHGHEAVSWVPRVDSRDLAGAATNLRAAIALHRSLRPSLVISAGAAQAVPHLLAAAVHRTPIAYVESAARLDGPSMTGRIAARLPRTSLVSPRDGWGGGWRTAPDVFSAFSTATVAGSGEIRSAVVALGSERFGFPRAVNLVRDALDEEQVSTTWQVGSTHPSQGVSLNRWLKADDLALAMCVSDVVVVHGGAGSILTALASGKRPIVLPRSSALGEHVDDHQLQMCQMLEDRGLVIVVAPGERITQEHLNRATSTVIVPQGLDDVVG